MENTVTAAPLLVRKGIAYTKLAVTQTGSGEERRGAVLHLGTGEGERENWLSKTEQKRWERCEREELFFDGSVLVCCRPRGAPPGGSSGPECHLTAGDPSVHLSGACQQHITAPGSAFTN